MGKVKEQPASFGTRSKQSTSLRKRRKEQYVLDHKGTRIGVILDLATYERLLDAKEELDDIQAYDEVKETVMAEVKAGKAITLQQYLRKRRAKAS